MLILNLMIVKSQLKKMIPSNMKLLAQCECDFEVTFGDDVYCIEITPIGTCRTFVCVLQPYNATRLVQFLNECYKFNDEK